VEAVLDSLLLVAKAMTQYLTTIQLLVNTPKVAELLTSQVLLQPMLVAVVLVLVVVLTTQSLAVLQAVTV
jgi:hypothetical protein